MKEYVEKAMKIRSYLEKTSGEILLKGPDHYQSAVLLITAMGNLNQFINTYKAQFTRGSNNEGEAS